MWNWSGNSCCSSPKSVLLNLKDDIIKAFKGGIANESKFVDLLVLMYELFMLARRKGTPALDEHVSDPQNSSIFVKYPSFLNDKGLVEFLCNSLRPIVDGRCKPYDIGGILNSELQSREAEATRSIKAVEMISDALPGVGIVAAVLGIINTMSNLEDPESVGYKVAAALEWYFSWNFPGLRARCSFGKIDFSQSDTRISLLQDC